jgi:hypothetical protein
MKPFFGPRLPRCDTLRGMQVSAAFTTGERPG